MKKKLLKILIYVSILSMLLTLCSGFAFAIDPVSTATMANALAQAITAYGASQGVSMTFDVASTDGIGEGVHELWNEFKEDIHDNNVPTYDSLALTMWASIYTKIGNNIGININDTEMPYIDAFWNWLLSGPAEMTKVDNQYYEWTLNQNNTVDPITVYLNSSTTLDGVQVAYKSLPETFYQVGNGKRTVSSFSNSPPDYYTMYINSGDSTNPYYFIVFSPSSMTIEVTNPSGRPNLSATNGSWRWYGIGVLFSNNPTVSPYNNISAQEAYDFISSLNSNSTVQTETNDISVKPYIGDTVPKDVHIPDNDDVNYTPLPYVGGLDIPWDDTLFGDGTGTLTDAQKQEIAGTIDNDITDSLEKTVTLVADDPEPAPNEVYIPFLPLQIPSFNFSFSGIWHYVVTWVGTLGSWFTAMFNMWSCLPYAMVIPVYATLVVVIVLGVYRRFLS